MTSIVTLYTDEDMSALVATLHQSAGSGYHYGSRTRGDRHARTDEEQLEFARGVGRCILTHNRVDFERLHLKYIAEGKEHGGIIIVPQKNAYEVARRVSILVHTLTAGEIRNPLLYA